LLNWEINLQQDPSYISYHTLSVSLHYLVKYKRSTKNQYASSMKQCNTGMPLERYFEWNFEQLLQN